MKTVLDRYVQKASDLHDAKMKVQTLKHEVDDIKKLYQEKVIFCGERDYGDGEAGLSWFIFSAELSNDEIYKHLTKLGIAEDTDRGVFDDNDWDCSGKCLFEAPGIIKRTKTKVLVTRSWAYDV